MKKTMLVALVGAALVAASSGGPRWTDEEIDTLASLHLGALEPLAPDPTNRYGDDPRAAALGHRLFFDARLSRDGTVSCGTCHMPELDFQDGKPLAEGVGRTDRRTMPIASTAHATWLFWDGRKDSQWSQALGPLESPVEHGGTRAQYAHLMAAGYRAEYEEVFGPLPDLAGVPAHASPTGDEAARAAWDALPPERRDAVDRVFANIGKAIAAYERKITHGPSRFDRWVETLLATGRAPSGVLTEDELAGARLFIGEARCINCHNGPLFTDDYFHNTGVPAREGISDDLGRSAGVEAVLADPFNCRGPYSDAEPGTCSELDFMVVGSHEMARAFRTPSLRNVAKRAPYMHAGQIATLEEVIEHYDRAPEAPAGHSELEPLRLSKRERRQLAAFLRALDGPLVAPAPFLAPPVHSLVPR